MVKFNFIWYFGTLFEVLSSLFATCVCYIFNKTVNAELQCRQGLLGQSYSAASFISRLLGCDTPSEVLVRQREFCVIQALSGPSLPAPSRSVKTGSGGTSLVAQWLRICLLMQGTRIWFGKIPHYVEQLSPWWATTTEPKHLEPVLPNKRSHWNEKSVHHNRVAPNLCN